MQVKHVTYTTGQLGPMKQFYAGLLGLPVVLSTVDRFTVRVGATLLSFLEQPGEQTHNHFALGIRSDAWAPLRDRIAAAVGLLADAGGNRDFFSDLWQSPHIYFYDPAGNNVEILAAADGDPWSRIMEVGLPLPDMATGVARLQGLFPTKYESSSETFRFYGDEAGVLVLVKAGRPWFPCDRPATIHPIQVSADAIHFESLKINEP